jgi:hypothetical protein
VATFLKFLSRSSICTLHNHFSDLKKSQGHSKNCPVRFLVGVAEPTLAPYKKPFFLISFRDVQSDIAIPVFQWIWFQQSSGDFLTQVNIAMQSCEHEDLSSVCKLIGNPSLINRVVEVRFY